MTPRAFLLVLLAAPALAGCTDVLQGNAGEAVQVEGPVRGYLPTNAYLKVQVETEAGQTLLVDFDRRDWHVSELARRIDAHKIEFLFVEARHRELPGEVLAETVLDPDDVDRLRYASMGASRDERLRLDAEYDALLRALPATPTAPGLPIPE